MNRKKYITLTLMLSLLCMNKAYAACTQEEINEFKKVEDEFKITYEFDKSAKDYTLIFKTPIDKKFDFIIYTDIKLNCKKINEEKTECYNIKASEYNLGIVGITENCREELKKITLKLSRHNDYSEDPLCKGIEEFVLCQPTYDKEIDYETFKSRVNTYLKSQKENETNNQGLEKDKINELSEYIKENLLQIIIIGIFIILMIITTIITIRTLRKSRRLE